MTVSETQNQHSITHFRLLIGIWRNQLLWGCVSGAIETWATTWQTDGSSNHVSEQCKTQLKQMAAQTPKHFPQKCQRHIHKRTSTS